MTEAHTLFDNLQHLVALLQSDEQVIERRHFCRPRLHICHAHLLAVGIGQTLLYRGSLGSLYVHVELTLAVEIVLSDGDIFNVHLRTGIEIHLAGNTCEAPEVLILQIRTVAPAHHLHGNQVLPFLQELGDVEFSCYLRVLRVANELAVDPYLQVAGGRAYMEVNVLSVPVGRQIELTTIRTSIVIGLVDIRWLAIEGGAPSVAHVLIDLVAVALNFEKSRYREIYPFRVIKLQ